MGPTNTSHANAKTPEPDDYLKHLPSRQLQSLGQGEALSRRSPLACFVRLAAMKSTGVRILCVVLFFVGLAGAQDVIPLYPGTPPGSAPANYDEKMYFSKAWNTEVVTNVAKPSLTVFRPAPERKNGTAVVVCPGGGFMALAIENEGNAVAKYLAAKGVTAFLLKYRLLHTGEDATAEFTELIRDRKKFEAATADVVALSIADGLAAVTYVRQHATDFGVSPDRVGIIGFSAGGVVVTGVAFQYTPASRPLFVAPIYPGGELLEENLTVPTDAPPMFIAAASDDGLGLAPRAVGFYNKWLEAHKSVELHMYAKGGHGFGMRKQNLPTDHWIDRFMEWMEMQGWMTK
jgi:acetyl esterase/lipase